MTKTITHGHGFRCDCNNTTGWSEVEVGLDATLSVEKGGYFKIEGICDNAGDEYAYYEYNISNILSNTYKKFRLCYKTSVASVGLGAQVQLVFTSGNQWLLGETTPAFSTTWKVVSGSITADKTIDKIRIYANDEPNTISSGTYQVYFRWLLLYAGDFTIPYTSEPVTLDNKALEAIHRIPGRVGNRVQYLGMDSPVFTLSGSMGNNTETWGNPLGAVMYEILYERFKDPWQYFTSNLASFRVQVVDFKIIETSEEGAARKWELTLRKHDEICGSNLWVWEYYG